MVDGLPLRWGFIFRSVRNYMSDWTEHWRSDDVYLWKNEPGYVSTEFTYASPHFNGARDMYDLADRATALKAVLDGAMMLGVGSLDRKSVVLGTSVAVRVELGYLRILTKN